MIRKENMSAIRHVPKKLNDQFFDDLDKYEGLCAFCAIFFRKRVVHGKLSSKTRKVFPLLREKSYGKW